MKKTLSTLFVILTIVISGCNHEEKQTNTLPSNWSTYRSETIPFRIRQQNFERGNLIPNSSFESGKLYGIESEQDAFNAPGWRRLGENVHWVNINSDLFDSSEVSSGIHSIKIIRKKSDETEDKGDGIISDFIKVIPGRYAFSLDIKLKDIKSSKSRLGTKLYDAIDIRIIYFDKNKIEISPNQYSNYYQTNINTSYKWLSFAHFTKIDSLDWTTVYCESAYPPFPDGYIPHEARFIKIFAGLKGSGTMWVDNINYQYTKDNFSLQERLEPYFTKEFDVYDLILPTPQKLRKKDQLKINPDSITNKNVLVVYPNNSSINKSYDFNALVEKLSKYAPLVKKSLTVKDIGQYNLIFSIGNTGIFNKTFGDTLFNAIEKNREQGYVIQSTDSFANIVFISSTSENGLKYGINTAAQLVDTSNNVFHNADITDWPELPARNVTINSRIEKNKLQDLVSDLRFNTIFSKNTNFDNYLKNAQGFIIEGPSLKTTKKNNTLLVKTERPDELNMNNTKQKKIWYYEQYSQLDELDIADKITQNLVSSASKYGFDGIVWKGTSAYSPFIDKLDYLHFREYTKVPIILTLNLSSCPYEIPVNGNNLLSLPSFEISGTIFDKIEQVNFEIDTLSVVNTIKLISMSCYSWNINNYNPDEVLYKILVKYLLHEDDIYKLTSLSDKVKILQWQKHSKNESFDGTDKIEFNRLINNYRFEEKRLDTIILNEIKIVMGDD